MIALDTNVILRYILRDDEQQTAVATRLIERNCTAESPGLLTLVVICEMVWVMRNGFKQSREEVARVLRGLFVSRDLLIEHADLARRALGEYETGSADYADYVIGLVARELGAEVTVTFDRHAVKSGLFRLLEA